MAYISVTDAVERTGKGQTTIYRFCRKYEHTKHIKREEKKFLIDEELLSKHFSIQNQEQPSPHEPLQPRREMVDMFIEELQKELVYNRRQLEVKDEQLARKIPSFPTYRKDSGSSIIFFTTRPAYWNPADKPNQKLNLNLKLSKSLKGAPLPSPKFDWFISCWLV